MNDHPFLVDQWDFLIVFLSVLVRMLFTMKYKAKEMIARGDDFSLTKYFDFKHKFRWIGHLITAVTFVLILPEVFVNWIAPKYFPEVTEWSFAADAVVGFLGYDLIKFIETITYPLINKWFKLETKKDEGTKP